MDLATRHCITMMRKRIKATPAPTAIPMIVASPKLLDDEELESALPMTFTVNEQLAVFPAKSVAMYVTIVFPTGKTELFM